MYSTSCHLPWSGRAPCAASLDSAAGLAAVDGDARASDEARDWRGEKGDHGGNLLGAAEAPEGHFMMDEARHLLRVRLQAARPGAAREEDRAGCDDIHPNVVRRQLARHRLRKADLRQFRHM